MITPDYLRRITERIKRIAEDMEDAMLVALILALYNEQMTAAEAYAEFNAIAEQYAEYGSTEIRRAFADAERQFAEQAAAEAIQEMFPDATQEVVENTAKMVVYNAPRVNWGDYHPIDQNAQKLALNDAERNVVESAAEDAAAEFHEAEPPAIQQTEKTWYNLTGTQAYATDELYVRTVDKAYIRTTTEEVSRTKAIEDAVDELAEQGVTIVENKRQEHTDTAIERNVRTAIARLAGDVTLQRAIENGYTLVLVSAHLGARPTHEVWQGKVYSIVGETDKYKDFFKETEYGEMLGLCGINCRHTFSPWKEGMNNPYADIDPEESRKRYDIEQKQRAMERNIRALKRKARALQAQYEATGYGKQELRDAKKELAEARREYKQFCAENDMRELTERLRIED